MKKYEERLTQEQQILKLLQKQEWTSSLQIVQDTYILQYNAKIWGLRKKGYKIESDVKYLTNTLGNKIKVWYYKLIR